MVLITYRSKIYLSLQSGFVIDLKYKILKQYQGPIVLNRRALTVTITKSKRGANNEWIS